MRFPALLLLSLALASTTAHAAPPLAASNVVTTPQVRAELVAHAPDGLVEAVEPAGPPPMTITSVLF